MKHTGLNELFEKAEQYGRVSVYTLHSFRETKYHVDIEFIAEKGIDLKAKSDGCKVLEDAFKQAIDKAQLIIDSVTKMSVERKLLK